MDLAGATDHTLVAEADSIVRIMKDDVDRGRRVPSREADALVHVAVALVRSSRRRPQPDGERRP